MAFQALKTLSAYSCTCGLYNTVTKNYTLHDKIYMPIPRDYILAKIVKTFKTCSRHGWQIQVCENSFKTIKSTCSPRTVLLMLLFVLRYESSCLLRN